MTFALDGACGCMGYTGTKHDACGTAACYPRVSIARASWQRRECFAKPNGRWLVHDVDWLGVPSSIESEASAVGRAGTGKVRGADLCGWHGQQRRIVSNK